MNNIFSFELFEKKKCKECAEDVPKTKKSKRCEYSKCKEEEEVESPKGLTAKQKKLPLALQKAILAKMKKK